MFVRIMPADSFDSEVVEVNIDPDDIESMVKYEEDYLAEHPNTMFLWSEHRI